MNAFNFKPYQTIFFYNGARRLVLNEDSFRLIKPGDIIQISIQISGNDQENYWPEYVDPDCDFDENLDDTTQAALALASLFESNDSCWYQTAKHSAIIR
jgi:hypothetical protein